MHQHHNHDQACAHHQRPTAANRRRLAWVLALAATYMVAEIVGGLLTRSLALLADAGHMFADVAALALSFFAVWIADRPAPSHRTYGYYRAEILAALINGAALVAAAILILIEAWRRLNHPTEVLGGAMMAVAVGGLLVNLAGLWILAAGRRDNLNMAGAWLHVLFDALGSVGAIVAGALVWAFDWQWADPAASVLICVLVIYASWRLLSESVAVLMESAPKGIDVDDVRYAMTEADGVINVHDLHVWTITSGLDSLSAHVVVAADGPRHATVLTKLQAMLQDRFGIAHITIQIEPEDFGECEMPV